jgi:hypothetical protein
MVLNLVTKNMAQRRPQLCDSVRPGPNVFVMTPDLGSEFARIILKTLLKHLKVLNLVYLEVVSI